MNSWMDSAWMTQLGWILLHSTWQFLLVAIAVAALSRSLQHSAVARHWLACGGLMMMAACPILTWWSFSTTTSLLSEPWQGMPFWSDWFEAQLPVLSLVWIVGALLFSIRPIAGCWGQSRLASQQSLDLPDSLAAHFERATKRIGIHRVVELRLVPGSVGPMVAGWFRPIVVVPMSIVSSMSPQEIEVLLAHELAHVRRHDCWVNVLQVVIETVFFYHPAVWWLSRQIRITREHCCDDMAAPDRSSRLAFGRALLALEQHRSLQLSLALSAGNGDLLRRIRRLSAHDNNRTTPFTIRLAVCVVIATVAVTITFALMPKERPASFVAAVDQQGARHESLDRVAGNAHALAGDPSSIDESLQHKLWYLTLEECVSIALQNSKLCVGKSGNAQIRRNVASQVGNANADQIGTMSDVVIQRSTTESTPRTVDGQGNRVLPRGAQRADQIGGAKDVLAAFDAQAGVLFGYSTPDRFRDPGGIASLWRNLPFSGELSSSRWLKSDRTVVAQPRSQHPLMRNRGTMVNRIPVVLASLDEDISTTEFEIQVRNLVRDVEEAYWDLYVAYRVSSGIVGRESALATAEFANLSLDNGIATKQELAQARGQLNVTGHVHFGVHSAERGLRKLMGLAATDGRLIRPSEEPSTARIEFDWDESVSQMLYLSPELRRARTEIKRLELELVTAKNELLPEVNLAWNRWRLGDTLGTTSPRDENFPDPGSIARSELKEGKYREGAIRLEITPSAIGRRRRLMHIRNCQLRITQSRAFIQEAERLHVSQLSDAVSKTTTYYQLVQTSAIRWQAAEHELEARLAELNGGGSRVNTVLQSQRRRAEAQISYYRAIGEYSKSVNYVNYLTGTMLANNNITLAAREIASF